MHRIIRSLLLLLSSILLTAALHAQSPFWMETSFNAGIGPVTDITVQNANTIMIATNGNGIHRSADYGFSWTARNNGLPSLAMRGLAFVDPHRPRAVARTPEGTLYYTDDGGASWSLLDSGLGGKKLVATAGDFSEVLASTGERVMVLGNEYFEETDHWRWVPAGLDEPGVTRIVSVAQGWYSSRFIFVWFAATAEGKVFRGVYTSEPDTNRYGMRIAWSLLPSTPDITNLIGSVSRDLYAGAKTLYRSTDNGDTWSATAYAGDSITAIAFNSADHIFVGTAHGVYRSLDRGATWEPVITGLHDMNVTSLAIDPRGYVFAGTASGKVYRSVAPSSTLSVNMFDAWPLALDLE